MTDETPHIQRTAAPDRLRKTEFFRTAYTYIATGPTTLDDLLRPDYWPASIAKHLKRYDRLEVLIEDGSEVYEFVVRDVASDGVHLRGIFRVALDGVLPLGGAIPLDASLRVTYEGVHNGWTCWRGAEVLRDKFGTEQEAANWLHSYAETVRRTTKGAA